MKHFKIFALLVALTAPGFSAGAQTYYDEEYNYLFDYDHRVVVRKAVEACEDYQDLWNGDYVRLRNDRVYIYRNGSSFTYGDKVWLMHNGRYIVRRSGYEYLLDGSACTTGVSGDVVDLLWNGICRVKKGSYWYLYTDDGCRLGSIYSEEKITPYWNGTYCYYSGSYYRVADAGGYYINNSYSDREPVLLDSGNYRVWRGDYSYVIDDDGDKVY